MSGVVYHLLTESEPFSEFRGGAISRWAGNVLRDASAAKIVCPSTDGTWKAFSPDSVLVLPSLARYRQLRRYLLRLPWAIHRATLKQIFKPVLKRLQRNDVVWIHNRPDFAIALAPHVHRSGGRVVLHMHNSHLVEWPDELTRQVRVDRIVFVSEFLLEQARHKFPQLAPSSVLYNGADNTIFYPAPDRRKPEVPTVLFAGRLVEDKGVHILIEAMKLLARENVKLQAHIVGSSNFGGSGETDYTTRLKASAPVNVTFLPYRSGMALGDLFREADIFCSPSIWDEPFGLVNVEAFASGLPVVSTRGGGATEIFAEGGGILVERGSAEQLASALRQLAEDATLRSTLGKQGYAAFLKRFTWSVTRTQVQEVSRSLSL